MIDFSELLQLQGQMLLLMVIGFFFRRKNLVSEEFKRGLTDVLLNVILPCNIVLSFQMEFDLALLKQTGLILVASTVLHIGYLLLNRPLFYRCEERRRPVTRHPQFLYGS